MPYIKTSNLHKPKTRIMKQLVTIILALLSITSQAVAQEKQDEHLLDGTSMNYYYQTGTAVHIEFADGVAEWKWIAGPWKNGVGKEKYRSRKIGDKMYLVNILEKGPSTFVTLIFNFNQNVMWSSVLLFPQTVNEQIWFDGGIIEQLVLKEN
jgi:hypothetical protein